MSVASSSSVIDVRDVLRGIARRWKSILAFTLFCALAGYAFGLVATPSYESHAQILIDNLESPYSRTSRDDLQRRDVTERDVTSQVEVMKSRDLALRVVRDLKLAEVAEFDPLRDGIGPLGRILIAIGFKSDPAIMTAEQRAMEHYYDNLKVYPVPQSSVIEIAYSAEDPQLSSRVANTLADYFVRFTKESQSEPTEQAKDWLEKQIEVLRDKVVRSEVAVEEFRSRAGLLRGTQTTLGTQSLSELNSQIILAAAARSEAQAKAGSIREMLAQTGTVDASADVLASPLIQRLREQQVALNRSIAELSTIYLDNHPRIIAVKRELQDLNQQLRAEAFKVVDRLEQEARIAASREATLRSNMNQLKQQAGETNLDDVKLRELEREAKANRTLLETFLGRYSDASTRNDVTAQPGLGRVISRAGAPAEPSFPKRGPIVVIATVGGLAIALGLAFLAEVMSAASATAAPAAAGTRAEPGQPVAGLTDMPLAPAEPVVLPVTAHRMQMATPAPVTPEPASAAVVAPPAPAAAEPAGSTSAALVNVPAVPSRMLAIHSALNAPRDPANGYARAIRPLVDGLATAISAGNGRFCSILSLVGEETDCSTFSLTAGRMLAGGGKRMLLVDADFAGEGIQLLDINFAGQGLADILAGSAAFSHIIRRDTHSELHVLGHGTLVETSRAKLAGQQMWDTLTALGEVYQSVLVNIGKADTNNIAIAARSDAVIILTAPDRLAEAGDIRLALESSGVKQVTVARVIDVGKNRGQAAGFGNIAASL